MVRSQVPSDLTNPEFSGSSRSRNSVEKRMKKMRLYKKQRGLCAICNVSVSMADSTIDHIIPLSKGGSWLMGNLQMTCEQCNQEKSNDVVFEEMRSQREATENVDDIHTDKEIQDDDGKEATVPRGPGANRRVHVFPRGHVPFVRG